MAPQWRARSAGLRRLGRGNRADMPKPNPILEALTEHNRVLLGDAGVTSLLAAYRLSLTGYDPDLLREVVSYPGLPRAYGHDFALTRAKMALRAKGDSVAAPVRVALRNKRAWMKGKCETARLRESVDSAIDDFRPTIHLPSSALGDHLFDELVTILGLAASLPNATRAATLTAWAGSWCYAWNFHRTYYQFGLEVPNGQFEMAKFRKTLRKYQCTPASLVVSDDVDAGANLERLCTQAQTKFESISAALQRKWNEEQARR